MSPASYLIVGVDYGTTFSGVSYAMSNDEPDTIKIDDVHLLTSWGDDSENAMFQKQVPSRIAYGDDVSWGYGVEDGAVVYCWTKLLLDRHATHAEAFDDEILREFDGQGLLKLPDGKSAEAVVTDYLTQLYQCVMEQLEQRLAKAILAVTPIQFWFTLPALWSIRAENATLTAAEKAGFGSRKGDSLHLVREPEAAATAVLRLMNQDAPHPLVNEGDCVLVCDCGGGTVDLASYEILSAFPKLRLSQACISKAPDAYVTCLSQGGKCGSTSIDRAFYQLMRDRFGPAFTGLAEHRTGPKSNFMKSFEAAKRSLRDIKGFRKYRLPLKMPHVEDSAYYSAEDNEVILTTAELRKLFDPTLDKIINLLEQQVTATWDESGLKVKLILLVGGFGESLYLYAKILEWCKERGIEVSTPIKSWEAICLGATLRGLEGPIVTKVISPCHIGTEVSREVRVVPGTERKGSISLNASEDTERVGGFASWIVCRGETLEPGTVKQRRYCLLMREGESKKWSEPLYRSEAAITPERIDESSVAKLCDLELDLSEVDFEGFPTVRTEIDGEGIAYDVLFEFMIVLDGDQGYIYFTAMCGGKKIGRMRLMFDDDDVEA